MTGQWLGNDDPLKVDALERGTLLTYFAALNKRIADAKKAIADAAKNNKGRGRTNHH